MLFLLGCNLKIGVRWMKIWQGGVYWWSLYGAEGQMSKFLGGRRRGDFPPYPPVGKTLGINNENFNMGVN